VNRYIIVIIFTPGFIRTAGKSGDVLAMNVGTILATLLLFMIVIGLFAVSAANDSANITNDSANITNDSINQTISDASFNAPVQPMAWFLGLTVTPRSVNLGTVVPDGAERTFTDVTTVRVQAFDPFGGSGSLYVRASGDFINSANTSQRIPLNNFQLSSLGYVTKRPFTTTDQLIHHFSFRWWYDNTYIMNYYLRVPLYTYPGIYSTTIIYTAISH